MKQYWNLFQDFLQLRAFILNIPSSLETPHEVDIFINRSTHAAFLNEITSMPRLSVLTRQLYLGPQLLNTLEQHLLMAHSPTQLQRVTPPTISQPPPLRQRPPFQRTRFAQDRHPSAAPIQPVAIVPEDDSLSSDPTLHDLIDEYFCLPIPNSDLDRRTYTQYGASINRIGEDPSLAHSSPCTVCGGLHRFDNCKVLQSADFLRQHYIRWMKYINREIAARRRAFPGPEGILTHRPTPIQALTVAPSAPLFVDPEDEFDATSDFQQGRP